MSRAEALEQRLGHRFTDAGLLEQALTHRSHGPRNNERLEFLGDGVLGCAVAEALYRRFPHLPEGKLTQMRASLVREEALAEVAAALGLKDHLHVGLGPRGQVTPSVLADAAEALFGAVFLDGGYAAARAAVEKAFEPLFGGLDAAGVAKDAKTQLQEIMQARRGALPEYRVVATRGEAHDRTFEVECAISAPELVTRGSGRSRQRAEQEAAQRMLEKLAQ